MNKIDKSSMHDFFVCRFLNYNVDWLQSCLGVNSVGQNTGLAEGSIPALIKPWGSEMVPPQSPFDMMNQIGGCSVRDLEYVDENVPFLTVENAFPTPLGNRNSSYNHNNNLLFGYPKSVKNSPGLAEGDWDA